MGTLGGGGSGGREQALGRNWVVRGNLMEKMVTEQRLEGGVGQHAYTYTYAYTYVYIYIYINIYIYIQTG